ncbi:MAG TPA: hypothetical protein PLN31_19485 [Azoarcus taiwanensis]|nr:hypothetical protein [Rhodocyclaceae bacterium]HRQ59605.1 hypothetical protein [Azoarcus taiwanensis]
MPTFFVWIVTAALSFALTKKPPAPPRPTMSDIRVPTAQEGGPIPVLFGTRPIKHHNVVWYGHLRTTAVKKKGGKK